LRAAAFGRELQLAQPLRARTLFVLEFVLFNRAKLGS